VRGEGILRSFKLSSCTVYASNERLIVKRAGIVTDYDYDHISSISFKEERHEWVAVLGIVMIVVAISLWSRLADIWPLTPVVLAAMGIGGVIAGILLRTEYLDVTVVGLPSPVKFTGQRSQLDSLLKLAREKKLARNTV